MARACSFHLRLHLGVLAANDDGLRRMPQARQSIEHARRGADPQRAAGDEKKRPVHIEAGLAGAARRDSPILPNDGIDRNAADRDVVAGQAEDLEVNLAFLQRDEVAMERAAEPHGVDVEVGHDDGKPRVEFPLADEVRDDFRRAENGCRP